LGRRRHASELEGAENNAATIFSYDIINAHMEYTEINTQPSKKSNAAKSNAAAKKPIKL
jgi:hypothetical protein